MNINHEKNVCKFVDIRTIYTRNRIHILHLHVWPLANIYVVTLFFVLFIHWVDKCSAVSLEESYIKKNKMNRYMLLLARKRLALRTACNAKDFFFMMYPQQTGRWLSLCLEITRTAYQIWEGHCLLPNDQVGTAISRSAALLKYFVQIFPLSKIDLYITSCIGISLKWKRLIESRF